VEGVGTDQVVDTDPMDINRVDQTIPITLTVHIPVIDHEVSMVIAITDRIVITINKDSDHSKMMLDVRIERIGTKLTKMSEYHQMLETLPPTTITTNPIIAVLLSVPILNPNPIPIPI